MNRSNRNTPPVKITAAMRQRFRRHAPAALARRNDAYLLGVAINVAQWLMIGSVGLVGLYHWHWTARDMLLVFVAGIVASIFTDGMKWLFARRAMLDDYQKMENDRLVWAMLEAEGKRAETIPADRLEPKPPGPALAMDIGLGALGVWWLSAQLPAIRSGDGGGIAFDSGVQLALIVVLANPLLSMLSASFAHRRAQGGYDDLEFRAGGRGIGLILLAAALGFFSDGEEGARDVMRFVNWATVVAGVMSIAGVAIMLGERNDLREHVMADAEADIGVAPRGGKKRTRGRSRRR
jgi:hypothetical protein